MHVHLMTSHICSGPKLLHDITTFNHNQFVNAVFSSVTQGDIVTLIRRIDENWLEGRIGQRQGIFPASYVQICREPATPMMTPLPSLAPTPIPGKIV